MLYKKPGLREKLEVQREKELKEIERLKDEELEKELPKKGRQVKKGNEKDE